MSEYCECEPRHPRGTKGKCMDCKKPLAPPAFTRDDAMLMELVCPNDRSPLEEGSFTERATGRFIERALLCRTCDRVFEAPPR